MKLTHGAASFLIALAASSATAQGGPPSCPPPGKTRAELVQLKQAKFAVASADDRNRLALQLLSCLADPDPAIRDGVVFEGLSTWLRGKALLPDTVLALEAALEKSLTDPPDARGFRRPFAALVLSEVARVDRIEPVFIDSTRERLVDLAATSLVAVTDYRGFDNREGWRHGVAHGSDLALQLALNQKVGAAALRRLVEAVTAQIAPKGSLFYTFGEPERLARAVIFIHRRNLLQPAFWEEWFAGLSSPKPLSDWGSAFQTTEGLARRHNTLAFLHALAAAGRSSTDEGVKAFVAMADKATALIMAG
jgi:hypothetical protein